jgi:hypothetical protein
MPIRLLVPLALLGLSLCAQPPVCATISPNPVVLGVNSSITVTVQDATGFGFEYQSACVARTVRVGTPGGPIAPLALSFCGVNYVPVAPFGSATKTFNIGVLSAGLYYVDVVTRPVGSLATTTTWVPFHVINAGDPVLTPQTTAQVGMPYLMDLTAPSLPGALCFTAAAFTTDVGFAFGSLYVSLDFADPLFGLSFPVPYPGLFVNFQAVTDSAGNLPGIGINIPNLPSLAYLPVNVQTVVAPLAGAPVLTNVVAACIAP